MLALGLVLSLFGIGFFCWLLFMVAVYALPFVVGGLVFAHAYHTGWGAGALLIGLLAGAVTLSVGQYFFATTRDPITRALGAVVFALPAAIMGYCMALGLSQMGTSSFLLPHTLAVIGAVIVGGSAWTRLSAIAPS